MRKYYFAIKMKIKIKYKETYKGNYPIINVWANVNVIICQDAIQEIISIRWIKTYQ